MDIEFLRAQFCGLDGDWALMDNAGGSQALRAVPSRIAAYLEDCNVQHGATYAPSARAAAKVADARASMAAWMNAVTPEEIIFGPSTTQIVRTFANSFGRVLGPGDEVVVTNCDHEANIGPWVDLERFGVRVRTWKVDPATLALRLQDLEPLMNERTRLVAFTHVSNILGRIHPLPEMTRFIRERGALSFVDGVAFAPHRAIDVQEFGADFYVLSLYKVFGPHFAMLHGRRETLLSLPGVNHYFVPDDALPSKFQPGGANFELTASLPALWDYVEAVSSHLGTPGVGRGALLDVFQHFAEHESRLGKRLLEFLASRDGVRVIGPETAGTAERVSTISFVAEGRRPQDVVRAADEARVGIRFGDFYAQRLITELGLAPDGVVRVSLLHYNTDGELDRLLEVLDRSL